MFGGDSVGWGLMNHYDFSLTLAFFVVKSLRGQEAKKEEIHGGQGGQVDGPYRDRRATACAA